MSNFGLFFLSSISRIELTPLEYRQGLQHTLARGRDLEHHAQPPGAPGL